MKINRQDLINLLMEMYTSDSTEIFSVEFRYRDPKKAGQTRKLTGAFNVKAYEVGGPPAYNPLDKRIFWVCDMDILKQNSHLPKEERPNPYRSIPWEGMSKAKISKVAYEVED